MKTAFLLIAVTACTLSSIPLASAQDTATPAKPAMSIGMMQMMMDQMLQHQQMMESVPAK